MGRRSSANYKRLMAGVACVTGMFTTVVVSPSVADAKGDELYLNAINALNKAEKSNGGLVYRSAANTSSSSKSSKPTKPAIPNCKSGMNYNNNWQGKFDATHVMVKAQSKAQGPLVLGKNVFVYDKGSIIKTDGALGNKILDWGFLYRAQGPYVENGKKYGYRLSVNLGYVNFDVDGDRIRYEDVMDPKTQKAKKQFVMDGMPMKKGDIGIVVMKEDGRHKMTFYPTGKISTLIIKDADMNKLLEDDTPIVVYLYVLDKFAYYRKQDIDTKAIRSLLNLSIPQYKEQKAIKADGKCTVPMGGGCFLTTAACETVGLADDCWELQKLRAFRDNHLAFMKGGQEAIAQYYATAPALVERLKARVDAKRVFLSIYWRDIIPSAVLSHLGFQKLAYWKYKRMMQRLEALA